MEGTNAGASSRLLCGAGRLCSTDWKKCSSVKFACLKSINQPAVGAKARMGTSLAACCCSVADIRLCTLVFVVIYRAYFSIYWANPQNDTTNEDAGFIYLEQSCADIRPYDEFDPLNLGLHEHYSEMILFRRRWVRAEDLHRI